MYLDKVSHVIVQSDNFLLKVFTTESPYQELSEDEKDAISLKIYNTLRIYGLVIYKKLQFSVLEGEYVNCIDFEAKLSGLKLNIKNLLMRIEDANIYANVENQFCNVIIDNLESYQDLVHKFNTHIINPDKIFLISDYGKNNRSKKLDADFINFNDVSELFNDSLMLSNIDIYFSLRIEYLKMLLILLKKFETYKKQNPSPIFINYLIDKCKLLIIKFRLRYKNDDIFRSMLISHDFQDSQFNPDSFELKFLVDWGDFVRNAYPFNRNDNNHFLSSYTKERKRKVKTFADYFFFVQYYRKTKESLTDIDLLISDYEQNIEEGATAFDSRSYFTCLNFLYNNRLSLWCKILLTKSIQHPVDDLEKINSELDRTKSLQEKTDVKNYYPYLKLAQCYSRYIDLLFNGDKINDSYSIIDEYLDKFNECLVILRKYFELCERSVFLPFQPIYEECKTQCKKANIFVYSSFTLPVDYEKQYENIKELESKYESQKIISSVHQSLKQDREKIKIAHEEARNSQKNNIQILAIFASLVVFSIGSIQLFQTIKNPKEAIELMLAYGFCLCLFALVIWIIVSSQLILKKMLLILITIYSLAYLTLYINDFDVIHDASVVQNFTKKTNIKNYAFFTHQNSADCMIYIINDKCYCLFDEF